MSMSVLPAYAGMIPGSALLDGRYDSAPRIRGDDPDEYLIMRDILRCSPHTRG